MKKSTWLALISLLVVGMLLVTACGPDPVEQPTEEPMEEPTEEPVEEPTEEPAEEPTEPSEEGDQVFIRLSAGAVGNEYEMTVTAAEAYMEENPNVVIEVIDTPDSATERLALYLQFFEAQSPELDVLQIDVIWPGDLAEHLVDLYEYGADEVADQHFPSIIENNTVDGRLVAMPWFTDAPLLYYRTDLLEKYGYDAPPTTWAELEEMAQTIQDGERAEGNEDFWGFVWQGNAYEGLTCDALEWIASNNGGRIVSTDGVITVNNPNAVDAIEMAADWVGTISPPGVTGFQEEDSRLMFQGGNAAFMRNWPYAYRLAQDPDESAIAGVFDVVPLPHGEGGESAATLGGWQLAVSQYSEHPEVAADVALYLTNREWQKYRAITGSLNPTIMDLYQDEDVLEATPFFGSLYDVFVNTVARPSTVTAPNYNETSTLFFTAVHNVLTGETDAQTALEELELDLEDLLGFPTGTP